MIDQKQREILAAVVQVLKAGGVEPWFEVRLIKDSDKKLNGTRISSKKKTDLDSVLAIADKKRVMLLPHLRMELRMYATIVGSRGVFLGQEMVAPLAKLENRGVTVTSELVQAIREESDAPTLIGVDLAAPGSGDSPAMADLRRRVKEGSIGDSEAAMRAALMPRGEPLKVVLPVLGVLNVDNPHDPRHAEWGRREGESMADYGQRRQGFVEGRANYSPSKNVERLRGEGLVDGDPLLEQAKSKVVLTPKSDIPRRSNEDVEAAASFRTETIMHTCDANGPMRQRESDGPFLTTCSLCGEFNAGST